MDKYAYTRKFTKIIQLEPDLLDTNIHEHISKLLKNERQIYCSKLYGYIISQPVLTQLGDYVISHTTGKCRIKAEYQCKTVKPESGHQYQAFIKLLYKEGIFAQTNQVNILVFIPNSELEDWTFTSNCFTKGKEKLEIGDWITIEIGEVEFTNHKYQCIGKLAI